MVNSLHMHKRRDTSAADGMLIMLLSLNLLLLVFFMMLNSMGTYGARHAEDVLAEVREGYNPKGPLERGARSPVVAMAAWQEGLSERLDGLNVNRLKLVKPPMEGNARFIDVLLPLEEVFGADGSLAQPATVRNLMAAAGNESTLLWRVEGDWQDAPRLAKMAASLVDVTGQAQVHSASEPALRLRVTPGAATSPDVGLAVQGVSERSGGSVQGMQPEDGQ